MIEAEPLEVSAELAQAQTALAHAKEEISQMRAALNQLSDGVIIADGNGNVLDWNPAALRLHGFSSVEQVRHHFKDYENNFIISRPTGERLTADQWPLARLMRGESVTDDELTVERLDVSQRWIISYTGTVIESRAEPKTLLILYLRDLTEFRRASAAERETALRLRGLIETAVDGILTFNEAGNIESTNPALDAVFGYRSVDLIGRHVTLLMPELLQLLWPAEQHDLDVRQLLQSVNDRREIVGKTANGQCVPLELSVGEMQLAGRRLFTAILRDISKRKEAERQLENHQSMLRTLIEAINDPVYIRNAAGQFLFVNAALARLAGRSVEACIGARSSDIFAAEVARIGSESDQRIMELPAAQTYEASAHIGAEQHDYLVTKCRFLNSDGSVGGIFGISREITRLKQAERAQTNSARHVQEIIDGLPVIVMVLSVEQRVVEMNRTAGEFIRALGLEPAQVINQSFSQLGLIGRLTETRAAFTRAMRTAARGKWVRLDSLLIQRETDLSYFDLTLSPLHDADGKFQHIILSAVDISQRKAAEQKSREQASQLAHLERQQTMTHMAAGLAHELNQPLGAIANYAAAAREGIAHAAVGFERLDQSLNRIVNESLRAGEIIRRMRGFVKKQKAQLVRSDFNQLVAESLEILDFELRQSGINTGTHLWKQPLPILVDPIQITQIIINLLRNAQDALESSPPGSRQLQIITCPSDDLTAKLQVIDNGSGVLDEDFPKLFDSFFTTKENGMGIGLALCRMIAENHRGQIAARRNAEAGMTFQVTLPLHCE